MMGILTASYTSHTIRSATGFTVSDYYKTLVRAAHMEELVTRHSQIMDRYDPEKRVGLIVDEWGAWYDVEPGTNPGFLYQQNTMRDALVAAVSLNIFNNHCDTVCMANIAQMVNVLQAMILTEGERMVLTPTYHVFALYKDHQNARQLESYVGAALVGEGEEQVPDLHVSASQGADGAILITAANLDDAAPRTVHVVLEGAKAGAVTARVLSGAANAANDFDHPGRVAPRALAVTPTAEGFDAVLPACAVAAFRVEP